MRKGITIFETKISFAELSFSFNGNHKLNHF
jgi:hypothetical protein